MSKPAKILKNNRPISLGRFVKGKERSGRNTHTKLVGARAK